MLVINELSKNDEANEEEHKSKFVRNRSKESIRLHSSSSNDSSSNISDEENSLQEDKKIKAKPQQPKNVTLNKLSSTSIASSCPPKQYSNNNIKESSRNNNSSSIEDQYVPEAEETVKAK